MQTAHDWSICIMAARGAGHPQFGAANASCSSWTVVCGGGGGGGGDEPEVSPLHLAGYLSSSSNLKLIIKSCV
jgi:hypothetical protein